ATIEYQGKKLKVKLRLKGHMTDHLQDQKWSFRVKVKDSDSFMGMKRFSIQHPGTRGYIYEWIYHQLMKREDIIALRYKFINVTLNGRDWGVYAVEENFDDELTENNNRLRGPIIRFNPDLYWIDRYNELIQSKPVAEFAAYNSAPVEAFREDKVLKDSLQRKYYLKAIALMDGFRSRRLSVTDVFDINRLAKFHAIIDLVGGQHSLDWSDIKYYYNPTIARLEPVAYESFSEFPFEEISGNYRFVELDSSKNYQDLHTALFSDPQFFREYIKELERISEPSYLDKFFNETNTELQNNLAILYKEFPYKKFDKQDYYNNQEMIKKILFAPKSFHAYLSSVLNNQVHLKIGSIDALPVEIKSLSIGNNIAMPVKEIILPSKQSNKFVEYKDCAFVLPASITRADSLISLIKVNYTILGSSVKRETKVFPFPHTDNEYISEDLKNKKSTVKDFSFLFVDEPNKRIFIKSGNQTITSDMIIPAGYQLIANEGVSLDLKNNSKIISYSAMIFNGSEDEPVKIESSDSTSQGIEIISASKSVLNYVSFKRFSKISDNQWQRKGAITFYESPVEFNNCNVSDIKAENAINIIRSDFVFKNCLFQKMNYNAVDIDFSEGTFTSCAFESCNKNALDITMSKVKLSSLYISGSGNKAINVKDGGQLSGNDVRIKNSNICLLAEDLSSIDFKNVTMTDSKIGLVAYQNKSGTGHPSVKINSITFTDVKTPYLKEQKSSIKVDGKETGEEIKDVKIELKSDKKKNK
ncbi:MAG: CotH kinase family protein, partial [Bacteroidia bacterium]